MQNKLWAKVLRIVGIVLMGLTAVFTIMGGAGTSCVALNPTGFGGKFSGIAPYQWLYLLFVLVTVAIGILGVRAVVLLVSGTRNAYRCSLVALAAGLVVGVIHIITSRVLRGGSMPVDGVVYVTFLTLVVFLLFRIPSVWQGVNFEKPANQGQVNKTGMVIALIATGLLTLTIQFFMAPTHSINGINYADIWHVALSMLGMGQIIVGLVVTLANRVVIRRVNNLSETNSSV